MLIEQSYKVVKANALIQDSRFKLSAQQQKVVLFLISKLKPDDEQLKWYQFAMKELCEIFGIEINGKNYINIKKSLLELSNAGFYVDINGVDESCRWIDKVRIIRGEGLVSIRLDETLKPYLLQLKNCYTQYEIENVLVMDSKYSIRMYELFKSYSNVKEVIIDLQELKTMLQADNKYTEYKAFRVNVIDLATKEINQYTDLNITYEPIRTVRTITALKFKIKQRNELDCEVQKIKRSRKLNGTA